MSIRLIVGLGNPGPEYEQTRHNAGFWFVDNLENTSQDGRWQKETRFSAFVAKTKINGHDVWLLKPQTFMNRSGQAGRSIGPVSSRSLRKTFWSFTMIWTSIPERRN